MKKSFVCVVILLLLTSCRSDKDPKSSNEVIPFSYFSETIATETINDWNLVEIPETETEVYFLDNMLIEDYGINTVNIYRAHFFSNREYSMNLSDDNWTQLDFQFCYYFGDTAVLNYRDIVYPPEELAFLTMDSVSSESYVGGDGTVYSALKFDLPYSDLPEAFENLQGDNMEPIDMWDINTTIDGIPVASNFEYRSTEIFTWPGQVDIILYPITDAAKLMQGNEVLLFPRGEYSDVEIVEENLQIVPFETAVQSVTDTIFHIAQNELVDTAYVFAARLMYYPACNYSIELLETEEFYYDYFTGTYDANVKMLPVWMIYYVTEFRGDSTIAVIPINAVTGESMYSTEYEREDLSALEEARDSDES